MNTYDLADTVYALSSGRGKAGVAVIRVSGKQALAVFSALTGVKNPKPRYAYFKTLKSRENEAIDDALALYFKAPHSFTGEDVVEFQTHGSAAVIEKVFFEISRIAGCRPAERGEFSRRAVVYGKMDLTEAEGIMDLIAAETEIQRKQAYAQMRGDLKNLYESWRNKLVRILAYIEAFIDFPEEDIPSEKQQEINSNITDLIQTLNQYLSDNYAGQKLRHGFQVTLVGEPNVGKSTLINALSGQDMSIVSKTAGTTRDIVQCYVDKNGYPIILSDTAGLREGSGEIEAEGIKRAKKKLQEADLIIHLQDIADYPNVTPLPVVVTAPILTVWNKADKVKNQPENAFCISAGNGIGITLLWDKILEVLQKQFHTEQNLLITHERYRTSLMQAKEDLSRSLTATELELQAEDIRRAAKAIGRITGQIETDELLDVIFKDFCIGK